MMIPIVGITQFDHDLWGLGRYLEGIFIIKWMLHVLPASWFLIQVLRRTMFVLAKISWKTLVLQHVDKKQFDHFYLIHRLKGTIDGKNPAHHVLFVKNAGITILFLVLNMGNWRDHWRLDFAWPRCTVKGRVVSLFRSSSATTDAKPAIRTLSATHSSLCRASHPGKSRHLSLNRIKWQKMKEYLWGAAGSPNFRFRWTP